MPPDEGIRISCVAKIHTLSDVVELRHLFVCYLPEGEIVKRNNAAADWLSHICPIINVLIACADVFGFFNKRL